MPGVCANCHVPSISDTFQNCAGCLSVSYCSRACQAASWQGGHSRACGELGRSRVKALSQRAARGGSAGASEFERLDSMVAECLLAAFYRLGAGGLAVDTCGSNTPLMAKYSV